MKMGLPNDLKPFDLKASYWDVDLEMPAGCEGVFDITAEFGNFRNRTRADTWELTEGEKAISPHLFAHIDLQENLTMAVSR